VLYRKRFGAQSSGWQRLPIAGSLLIQPFEGSRFGMLALWILNNGETAGCEWVDVRTDGFRTTRLVAAGLQARSRWSRNQGGADVSTLRLTEFSRVSGRD
jgi:hypothetical protein